MDHFWRCLVTKRIYKFFNFLGKEVSTLIVLDLLLGLGWFLIETGFLLVFQGFLVSIDFITKDMSRLPEWYPKDLLINLFILAFYGLLRAVLTGAKGIVPSMSLMAFTSEQRIKILEKSFFTNHRKPTSEIVSVFGELTTKAGQFIQYCSMTIAMGIVVILLMIFALRMAPIESLISFSALLIVIYPLKKINKKIQKYGQGLVLEWGKANKVLIDGLKNIFLLRIYNLLNIELAKGSEKIHAYENEYKRYLYLSYFISSIPLFLGLLIIAGVTFISKKYLQTDSVYFIAFLYLFLRIAQSASQLSNSINNAWFYKESFLKLYHWTGTESDYESTETFNGSEERLLEPVKIKFSEVNFSYVKNNSVIKDLTLNIDAGDFLLIKGPSGAGKSTLIKLLTGMLLPVNGKIEIANISPTDFIKKYSDSIGYVGPEPFLITGSVRENLMYGNSFEVSEEEITELLTNLGLADVVFKMPEKLDEILYEDTQLSTGQKQRLSFARAILRAPKLLVLDEATANIDLKTESLILNYLKHLKGKMTVVAISHRESFDSIADIQINIGA